MITKLDKKKSTFGGIHGPKRPLKGEIKQHLKGYASSTTAHGIFYIAEDGRSFVERVFWIIVVVLAIGFSYYQTHILYKDWQDDPVITTLDTVSLPIEEIEFPAVTICPQGSIKSIAETVLFRQLSNYIRQKREAEITRVKREDSFSNTTLSDSLKNDSTLILTYDEMMSHVDEFLKDVYPGAKDKPTKLVHLLTSNQPRKMMANDAVMYKSFEEKCDEASNEETLEMLNKDLNNDTCDVGFEMVIGVGCLHTANTQMAYDEANSYCTQQGGSQLLHFTSNEELQSFKGYPIPGKDFS